MEFNIKEMFGNMFPKKTKKQKMKIPEALEILTQEESQRLIDMDQSNPDGKGTGGAVRHHLY